MNIYVQFIEGHAGYLNLKPDDDESPTFYYFRLESGRLVEHNHSFNNYVYNIVNSKDEEIYYFFTRASTPDELYSMHPELFI